MRHSIAVLAAFAVVLAAAAAASGTTYYVSTSGSDSWPGSQSQPWATLQKAANTMSAGDTTIVLNGTYAGFRITDSHSGTSGAPITIKAQNVRQVTLNNVSSSNSHNGIIELEGNWDSSNDITYWVIDGFVVDGGSVHRAIDTRVTGHLTVQNCTAHHSYPGSGRSTGIFAAFCNTPLIQNNISYSNTEHGIYVNNSADNGTLRGNTIYSNTSLGIHMNGDESMGGSGSTDGDGVMSGWTIEKNTSYSNGSNGYDADGVEQSTWRNNLAYNNSSKCIHLTGVDGSVTSRNNNIFCNTLICTGYYAVNILDNEIGIPAPVGNKVKDNILYHTNDVAGKGSICISSSGFPSFESDYNVVMSHFGIDDNASTETLSQWRSRGYDTHSIQASDTDLFVSPGSNDYHLKAGSPAINAGTTISSITDDHDGNARPQGSAYDMGCYESGGGSALSITTSSLPADTVGIAYNQTLQATGGSTPYTWSLQAGSLPAGLSLVASTGAITGTPTAAGTSSFTAKVTDNVAATATRALSIAINAAPSITTSSLPADTVGVAYNQTLAATGGTTPLTWSLQSGSLPAGLSLVSSSGAITGTPTAAGTSNFTAKVTDAVGASATKALSIVINAAISITTASLPTGTIGAAYSQTLAATGGTGALTWSIQSGTLPAGLSLNASTGAITGTPTASGTSNFTAKATDTVNASATRALSIAVTAALSITTASLPHGTVNVAYNQTLAATGGITPYTWSLASGSLPTGLSLNTSSGAITGTPTASGTSNFTARVTDSLTASATKALSIVVDAQHVPGTYYVATNGNDTTGDGSSGNPWLTIQKGVDTILNGDTLIVISGSYAGARIRYSGASGMIKTVKSEVNYGAVITSAGALCTTPSFVEIKADTPANGVAYWQVEGFETNGGTNYGIEMQYGDHVTIKNCKAHASAKAGMMTAFSNYCTLDGVESYSAGSGSGFYIGNSGDNCTVIRCLSHNNPTNGFFVTSDSTGDKICSGWMIEKNASYSNGKAMTLDGLTTSTVRNNLAYGQPKGVILLGFDSATTSNNDRVLNNTILNTSAASGHCINIHNGGTGLPAGVANKLFNNVLYNYSTGGTWGSVSVDTAAETNFQSDYNVVMSVFGLDDNATILTLAQWRALGYDVNSIQAADTALFVNPGGADYHLKAGSPAINKGTTLADVTDDKDNNSRPQGTAYDIGCYEYVIAPLVITTSSLPGGTTGVAYSQTLAATGGITPYTWSLASGDLPTGLTLNTSSGVISGTPTASGTSNFTVRVTDSQTPTAATSTQALSIVVSASTLTITTASLPNGTMGSSYSQTLAATGGVTPYTWSVSAGNLPAGLSLAASTGVISGTPTGTGTSNFTAMVTDSQTPTHATATKALSIIVNAAPLSITTTSLPNGTVGASYSQTLAATGGITPYSWSVTSGSLPAGLSLTASTGAITGTPSASGTSNFTVQVTDSQTPTPATSSKALSIVVNPSGTNATYQFTSSESEASTTSTAWQTKATLTFTPAAADDWILLGFAEVKESSTSYEVMTQLVVDGTTEGQQQLTPKATTDYAPYTGVKFQNLSAASHTITLQYASSNASGTAYIRSARVVALRKAAITFYQTASDSTVALTTTLTNYATLTFTPSVSNDYLFIYSAEISANTSYSTQIQANWDGGTYDEGFVRANNNSDYSTFTSFAMLTPSVASHTATIAAAKGTGSTATHNIRRARIIAFQLTGGRFANYYGKSSDALSTTTSTAWVQKLTGTWTAGNNGNWLFLNSARLGNAGASYSTEARVQFNNSITNVQQMRQPKNTSDYLSFNCVDVRSITTPRTVDIDYRSSSASGTARIKFARSYQMPLDD